MVRNIVVTSVIDAVVDDLKAQVLAHDLRPGMPLTEAEVAARYDVARATAKAAIERLVADKVLVRKNHKTARVVKLGPADVRDIYRTRAYLESEVLRRLAELEGTLVPVVDLAGQARAGIDLRRRNIRGGGQQQHVVKSKRILNDSCHGVLLLG